jgi:hypothetical protein
MTAFALNYAIRNTKGALKGNLGWLFTMYYLHSDQLLRCFPSNETLKEETGIKHDGTLQKQRDQLIAMKALILVPNDKRLEDKEKALHPRRYVYQITGIIELKDGTILPTVLINSPEVLDTHMKLLKDLGFDEQLVWRAFGHTFQADKPQSKKKSNPAKNEGLILQKLQVAKSEDEVVKKEKEEVEKETTSAPLANGDTSYQGTTVQQKLTKPEQDAWYEAVNTVWGFVSGRNVDYQKFVRGEHTKKTQFTEYALITSFKTPEQLIAWGKFEKSKHPELTMISSPVKVQDAVENWMQQESKPKVAAPLRFTQRKQPVNLDILDTGNGRKETAS